MYGIVKSSSAVSTVSYYIKVKSYKPSGPLLPELYPGFRNKKRLGVLLLLLDGMLVHRREPPSISSGFPDSLLVPIYTPGLREVL